MKKIISIFATVIIFSTSIFSQERMPLTLAYLEKIGENHSSVQVYLSGELILTKVEKDQKAEIKNGKLVENFSTKTTELIIRYKEKGQITDASRDQVTVKFDKKNQEMSLVFKTRGTGSVNSFFISHGCKTDLPVGDVLDNQYDDAYRKELALCKKPIVMIGDDEYIVSNKNTSLEIVVVKNSKEKKVTKKSKGVKVK